MTDEITAVTDGIAAADAETRGPDYAKEKADVDRWFKRIDQARKFDAPARRQYAIDRRYARGDSGFEVDANLIGTFIDILVAFLYARDPDVDVLPAKRVQLPDEETLREAAELWLETDMRSQQMLLQAQQQAASAGSWSGLAMGQDPAMAGQQAAEDVVAVLREEMILARVADIQAAYRRRIQHEKQFAETMELVVSRLWKQGKLKQRARTMLRSGLTIAVGWMKASWQERTAKDPQVLHKIADLKDNIARAAAQKQAMEEASGTELDAMEADYQRQLEALEGQAERVIARGFAIDFGTAEDMTLAPGIAMADYLDSPWISQRIAMLHDDAVAEFALSTEKAKKLTRYSPRKPVMKQCDSPNVINAEIDAKDADAFTTQDEDGSAGDYVMLEEIWDRDTNSVLTGAHGLDCWLKPSFQPAATSRFYPFFLLAIGETDGQRHPQSLPSRSAKLVDEYNRIGSQEAEHRRRIKPKTLFHAGMVGEEQVTKVVEGATGEFVGVVTTQPNADLRNLFMPMAYPPIDPALYDRSRIINELERIWGIQEALAQSISTEKTATEAEIQQSGFAARTGSMRDILETVLNDLAVYTAEVAQQSISDDDVRQMVGEHALWPEWRGPESLQALVNVEIRAGSSGKPNTSAEREAWAAQLPLIKEGIVQIAKLRGSDPKALADSVEELLRITAERSGDRIDIDALVPQIGAALPIDPNAPPESLSLIHI